MKNSPALLNEKVSERWASLRATLDRWISGGKTAGLQYLLMGSDQVLFEHCAGVADCLTGQQVSSDTQFNLYSLTKPLTATLVIRLALQSALDLEEPIAQAAGLPAARGFGTVRDALLHRAGFSNPVPLRWFHLPEEDGAFDEFAFVEKHLNDAAAHGPKTSRYSNIGYLALGRAVERATGLNFRAAMHQRLIHTLRPAQVERLTFTPASPESWSLGHVRRASLWNFALGCFVRREDIVAGNSRGWTSLRQHHVNGSAYGGLIGNARGLARFATAVLGQCDGIDEHERRLMCEVGPGTGNARSLALETGSILGESWLGHAGGGLGAYAELRLYPARGVLSVLVTNRPGYRDLKALDELDSIWLRAQS